MLDANAFDFIVDRGIDPKAVRSLGDICITTVQHGELLDVPDPRRRKRLLDALTAIDPTVRPASLDVRPDDPHRRGHGTEETRSADIVHRLRGTARRPAKWKDAAIGEVADLEGCILVTDDRRFRQRAAELGVAAFSCEEAFSELLPRRE